MKQECIIEQNEHLLVIKTQILTPKTKTKLALFDLDKTLIAYDESSSDFTYLKNVKQKLLSLHEYTVGIISNQNLLIEENRLDNFKEKMHKLINDLNIPIIFIASIKNSYFRKPSIGMYEYLIDTLGIKEHIDSFFVGDAAGRNTDPSDCDAKFALNCGLKFYTPDEFFGWDTNAKAPQIKTIQLSDYNQSIQIQKSDVVFVYGKTFSGKRTFIRKYFEDYRINPNKVFRTSVFVNCRDLNKIKEAYARTTVQTFVIDYGKDISQYLRNLAKLSGEIPGYKNWNDEDLLSHHKNIIRIPFCFDNTGYSELKLKLSKLQL